MCNYDKTTLKAEKQSIYLAYISVHKSWLDCSVNFERKLKSLGQGQY